MNRFEEMNVMEQQVLDGGAQVVTGPYYMTYKIMELVTPVVATVIVKLFSDN